VRYGELSDAPRYVPHRRLLSVAGGGRLRDRLLKATSRCSGRPRAYWWRGEPNFGDAMAPDVLSWALGSDPVWVSSRYEGKLVGQGSLLRFVRKGDLVWGAGTSSDKPFVPPEACRFLAVRGPLTRRVIRGDVPEVYGDPALLLPRFHDHAVEKRFEVGVVPHYLEFADALFSSRREDPAICLVDVRKRWQTVVDQIRSCDAVISSSLHGLIVAEAYGIPASWVRFTPKLDGKTFKFHDHYLATGRDKQTPTSWAEGIDAALTRAAPPMAFDTAPLLDALRTESG
jgi:pyruvyltransferase